MDAPDKREALRTLSNGLYIVTSSSGECYGAAVVAWLSQVSFEPPLVMAAIRKKSKLLECLLQSGVAAIHVLSAEQEDIAQKFFAPTKIAVGLINGEPFVKGQTSAPILQNLSVYMECRFQQVLETGGDHAIVVLEVVAAKCRKEVRPLTVADSPWHYGG
jgi:flavin reductase (DIM6/NTAB) family NADH-FMN oxidoreductase RutF